MAIAELLVVLLTRLPSRSTTSVDRESCVSFRTENSVKFARIFPQIGERTDTQAYKHSHSRSTTDGRVIK